MQPPRHRRSPCGPAKRRSTKALARACIGHAVDPRPRGPPPTLGHAGPSGAWNIMERIGSVIGGMERHGALIVSAFEDRRDRPSLTFTGARPSASTFVDGGGPPQAPNGPNGSERHPSASAHDLNMHCVPRVSCLQSAFGFQEGCPPPPRE